MFHKPSKFIFSFGIFMLVVCGALCYMIFTNISNEIISTVEPFSGVLVLGILLSGAVALSELLWAIRYGEWYEDELRRKHPNERQKREEEYIHARIAGEVKNRREWRQLQKSNNKA